MTKKDAITKMQAILIIAIIIVAAIVGAASYFLFFQKPPVTGVTLVIGADLPLTGKQAYFGEIQKIAYGMAIDDINAKGGIMVGGQKVKFKFVYYNDESDPTKATTNVVRLMTVDGAQFILGPWTTPLALPVGAYIENSEALMIAVGTGTLAWETNKYNRTFIVYQSSVDESNVVFKLLEALPNATRPKKLAIWEEDSEVGRTYAAWAEKHATETYAASGYQIVQRETFTPGSVDYSSLILHARDAGAEVVFTIATTADAARFLAQSKELGFSPKVWHLLRGAEPPEFWTTVGADGEAVLATMTGFPRLPRNDTQELANRYRQEYNKEPPPYLPVCYAAVQVLIAAIEKADSYDSEAVRQALCTLDVDTIIGRVKFNGPGHASVQVLAIQWQNGVEHIVWPPELKTADFEFPKPPWS